MKNLFMVKVVFEYFTQYFKVGKTDPYSCYDEKYMVKKAFKEGEHYEDILAACRKEMQTDFELSSVDTDDDGEPFNCEITYDNIRLISYKILAVEDKGVIQ